MSFNTHKAIYEVTDHYEGLIFEQLYRSFMRFIENKLNEEGKVVYTNDVWALVPLRYYTDVIERYLAVRIKPSGMPYERIKGYRHITLEDDWKERLTKRLHAVAAEILIGFQMKMVEKIGAILKNREDVASVETFGTTQSGCFIIRFTNEDSFTVQNNIIINVSCKGKLFNQFPTTFGNIKKGGEVFKKKSEKWMKENF